ncbi:hypothetical protein Y1Q_0004702 [Alligator mississippiensis]|uniref:Uncharacterized protein n=1 Tax=Alligator mississippiensis TaxID=8496 RepID=A0A151P6H6_ALLMI|nr:hypothetical protein Y1Q_0004702 [Alligator mississippiensis]
MTRLNHKKGQSDPAENSGRIQARSELATLGLGVRRLEPHKKSAEKDPMKHQQGLSPINKNKMWQSTGCQELVTTTDPCS